MIKIKTRDFSLFTNGNCDILDITDRISGILEEEGFKEGNVTVFVPGATAGISTVEYEPGLLKDLPAFFERIIPENGVYYHELTWHDGNGHSHVRATLLKPSLTIPFKDGKLITGTWQQIILVDFDNHSRNRRVVVQIIGETYD